MLLSRNKKNKKRALGEKSVAEPALELLREVMEPTDFVISSHRVFALLSLCTLVSMSLIFAPISFWPLSFVCLVPWLVLVGGAKQAPRVYFYSLAMGLAFFLINMRWMYLTTGAGYAAMSVYLSCYFPLMACPVRSVVRRRRWPLAVVFPFVWVGSEIVRSVVISGFPWFYLAHSLSGVEVLIQISDLVGAYGVSFVIAAVNGAVADVIIKKLAAKQSPPARLGPVHRTLGGMVALGLVVFTVGYGVFQLNRDTTSVGPKIATLQGDFVNLVEGDTVDDEGKRALYLKMLKASAKDDPDLYLLPETPWIMYLNEEARHFQTFWLDSFQRLQRHASEHQAYVVTGSASLEQTPDDLVTKQRRYNSANVFHPDAREPDRYDKVHLVYFGETVPFRFGNFRFLYFWLNRLMPFSGGGKFEYSLIHGAAFDVFPMEPKSQPGKTYRFGIPICYEDVMPYVSRAFTVGADGKKRVDFLLNISNDGWFGRGIQQPQHLAISTFRAVENRIGIVRAVNTGISAFIDPSGCVHDMVDGYAQSAFKGNAGYATANVLVDSRFTYYSKYGDWFGWLCAVLWLAFFVDYWIVRVRTRNDEP